MINRDPSTADNDIRNATLFVDISFDPKAHIGYHHFEINVEREIESQTIEKVIPASINVLGDISYTPRYLLLAPNPKGDLIGQVLIESDHTLPELEIKEVSAQECLDIRINKQTNQRLILEAKIKKEEYDENKFDSFSSFTVLSNSQWQNEITIPIIVDRSSLSRL